MRKNITVLSLLFAAALAFSACSDEESVDISSINKQTVLVFMPWSGSATHVGLYPIFLQNLDSIEGAITKAKGLSGRTVVFLSTSATTSTLYELTYSKGKITHTPIKSYQGTDYTTSSGITQILNDVKSHAHALNYAMMVGCHGSGWTYKTDWNNYPYQAKLNVLQPEGMTAPAQSKALATNNNTLYPTTRFFGSVADMNNAIDVADLATGIKNAGIKMQYILFDDCYMANVETAYELRQATNYLIASTSEVMAIGVPYQTIWSHLAKSTPSYSSAVASFKNFYASYTYPYGSLSAIDCREVDKLATIMKEINVRYSLADSLRDSLQVLDGFTTPIFYDLGSYADRLCTNASLLSDFRSQLTKVVKHHTTTDSLYTNLYGTGSLFKVKDFSAITTSDPSLNSVAIKGREKTAWWRATHE